MRKNNTANNFWRILLAFVVGAFVFGNFAEAQTKRPKKKPVAPTVKQSNDKIEYAPDADLLKEMRARITVVESKKDWKRLNQRPVVNRRGTRSAYLAEFAIESNGEAFFEVIVIHDSTSDKFYEIRGFDFARPFNELKWTSDDVLQFEQWVNPRNGGRYAINLKTGKVVAAGYVRSN